MPVLAQLRRYAFLLAIVFSLTISQALAVTVLPLGDSLTYGATGDGKAYPGYREDLLRHLAAKGLDIHYVGTRMDNASPYLIAQGAALHSGYPGYRIDQIVANLDGDDHSLGNDQGYWLTGSEVDRLAIYPDVILLMAGTNDIVWQATPEQAVARMSALIDKLLLLRPNATVIVALIPPMFHSVLFAKGQIYNEKLQALVAIKSASLVAGKLQLADLFTPFIGQPERFADLIHPDALGYQQFADQWLTALTLESIDDLSMIFGDIKCE